MSDHRNGMKKQGRDQKPLHGQQKFNDDKQDQKQPGQQLGKDQQSGPRKEQMTENLPSERNGDKP